MPGVFKRDKRSKDSTYTVWWIEHGRRRYRRGYTDKDVSRRMAQRLQKQADRCAEGLTEPADEHRQTPIQVHVGDFITTLPNSRSPRYRQQHKARIFAVIKGTQTSRLHELDHVKIKRYLDQREDLGDYTRNEYITSIKALTRWAMESDRLVKDPLKLLKPAKRKAIEPEHPRRALTTEQIAMLLDAAVHRPLYEKRLIRRGANKGKLLGKVTPRVERQMILLGRNRRMAYLIAVWTGLRRAEIKALRWGDLELDRAVAKIRLRASTTKSKRADVTSVHPQLADELRKHRPLAVKDTDYVVTSVPDMKAMRADLSFAKIEYVNEFGRFVDFHSLRLTCNTMLAAAGVSHRVRQAHMRHTDPRLTANTYMDETLLPIASEVAAVPAIPDDSDPIAETITLGATGTDRCGAQRPAQQKVAPTHHSESLPVTHVDSNGARGDVRSGRSDQSQVERLSRHAIKKQSSSSNDDELLRKRVIGLEPTTFTLAT